MVVDNLSDTIDKTTGKTCGGCNRVLPLDSFGKHSAVKSGKRSRCKECRHEEGVRYRKQNPNNGRNYYKNNREKQREYGRRYYQENRDYLKSKTKAYRRDNKEKRNAKENERFATDLQYRLTKNIRTRLRKCVKRGFKAGSSSEMGCTGLEFKEYIESLFWPNMTWDNYGKEWELDHVSPLSKSDLCSRDSFLAANHFTNVQPLWKDDNENKLDRLDWSPTESVHEFPERLRYLIIPQAANG